MLPLTGPLRSRLPHNALGFGKDLFKLSDHAQAITTGKHDHYLPISHTCFFALELPRSDEKRHLRRVPRSCCTPHARQPTCSLTSLCRSPLSARRYTSKSVLSSKLLYAISNCQSIDGDATHEGRANMMMAWGDEEDD